MLAELRGAQSGLWAMRIAVGIVYAATSLHPRAAEQAAKPVPTVNVITFGGGYALPLWAAERQGFFRKHGMTDADVKYVRTGGGPTRMRELVARKYAAGLLATPLDLIAEEKGLKRLGTARELLGRYQGRAAYSQRSWVRSNEATVIAFMRGYRDAMEWLYDRGNREIAAALLVANDASMTPALARRALDVLLDEKDGFFRDVALDIEGVKTVLALRTKFLPPATPINDPMKYVDLELYRKAFPAR